MEFNGDQMLMFVDSPNDAVKQYNVFIDTWSLRHLTSAEEYPDEEYLDMSKSSSLKQETSAVRLDQQTGATWQIF